MEITKGRLEDFSDNDLANELNRRSKVMAEEKIMAGSKDYCFAVFTDEWMEDSEFQVLMLRTVDFDNGNLEFIHEDDLLIPRWLHEVSENCYVVRHGMTIEEVRSELVRLGFTDRTIVVE